MFQILDILTLCLLVHAVPGTIVTDMPDANDIQAIAIAVNNIVEPTGLAILPSVRQWVLRQAVRLRCGLPGKLAQALELDCPLDVTLDLWTSLSRQEKSAIAQYIVKGYIFMTCPVRRGPTWNGSLDFVWQHIFRPIFVADGSIDGMRADEITAEDIDALVRKYIAADASYTAICTFLDRVRSHRPVAVQLSRSDMYHEAVARHASSLVGDIWRNMSTAEQWMFTGGAGRGCGAWDVADVLESEDRVEDGYCPLPFLEHMFAVHGCPSKREFWHLARISLRLSDAAGLLLRDAYERYFAADASSTNGVYNVISLLVDMVDEELHSAAEDDALTTASLLYRVRLFFPEAVQQAVASDKFRMLRTLFPAGSKEDEMLRDAWIAMPMAT